jgi:3-hydroxyacyl-[acyl-carrier-protein] dehydratase
MRHFWVDRILELEEGVRAVGIKNVALSEDVFDHHFPGNPVFPGVYLLEGLAQTAGVLLARSTSPQSFALMVSVDRARFSAFARPGDTVRFEVHIEEMDQATARVRCSATVQEKNVAAARISFRLLDPDTIIPSAYQVFWEQYASIWQGKYLEGGNA